MAERTDLVRTPHFPLYINVKHLLTLFDGVPKAEWIPWRWGRANRPPLGARSHLGWFWGQLERSVLVAARGHSLV